jgi:hypothetical protein
LLSHFSEAASGLALLQPLVFEALNDLQHIDFFELAIAEELQRLQEVGHCSFLGCEALVAWPLNDFENFLELLVFTGWLLRFYLVFASGWRRR